MSLLLIDHNQSQNFMKNFDIDFTTNNSSDQLEQPQKSTMKNMNKFLKKQKEDNQVVESQTATEF